MTVEQIEQAAKAPIEEWKDIAGFEGLYAVSNLGKVKRVDCIINYKDGRAKRYTERILATVVNRGYLYVTLSKAKVLYTKKVHRLVGDAFILNPDKKPCINHKNGIRSDNRVENLEWCTYGENGKHRSEVLGFKHSESTRRLISDRKRKKVYCTEDDLTHDSIADAAIYYKVDRSTIYQSLKLGRMSRAGKSFKYII